MDRDALAELFGQIAVRAGAIILPHRIRLDEARRKADGSPVTDADEASERFILSALRDAVPEIPVIAEEEQAAGISHAIADRFILVDPLDGTREFIRGRAEFAVNIGLIEGGIPVAGAIYAPLLSKLWIGGTRALALTIEPGEMLGAANERRIIATRDAPKGCSRWWRAVHIPTARPGNLSSHSRLRSGFLPVPRLSFVLSRKGVRISIRVLARRWNGTWRPDMRSFPQRGRCP